MQARWSSGNCFVPPPRTRPATSYVSCILTQPVWLPPHLGTPSCKDLERMAFVATSCRIIPDQI